MLLRTILIVIALTNIAACTKTARVTDAFFDKDAKVRAAAVHSLQAKPTKETITQLVEDFRNGDAEKKKNAGYALLKAKESVDKIRNGSDKKADEGKVAAKAR